MKTYSTSLVSPVARACKQGSVAYPFECCRACSGVRCNEDGFRRHLRNCNSRGPLCSWKQGFVWEPCQRRVINNGELYWLPVDDSITRGNSNTEYSLNAFGAPQILWAAAVYVVRRAEPERGRMNGLHGATLSAEFGADPKLRFVFPVGICHRMTARRSNLEERSVPN